MDAQVLLNGKYDLADPSHPARRRFRVAGVKQLLYVSGSVYYDREDPEGGPAPAPLPMEFGISILVDGSKVGAIRIGKSDERSHSAAVPGFFQLRLPVGDHEIDLQNSERYQSSPDDFFCITLFDLD
jgi:hypothetical protein